MQSEKNKAAYAMSLGRRMARLGEGWMMVGHAPGERAGLWAKAALLGGCEAGAKLFELGEVSRPVFQFAMAITRSRGGIYINGGERPTVQLLGELGLPLSQSEEQLLRPLAKREDPVLLGRQERLSGLWEMYCSRLHRMAGEGLKGSSCVLRCGNPILQRQAREVLSSLGCQLLQGPVLWLNNTGERLAAFTPDGEIIPYHQLVERAGRLSLAKGHPVALPEDLSSRLGSSALVLRYSTRPAAITPDQRKARELAAQQLWERDGLMLAVLLLCNQHCGSLDPLPENKLWHPTVGGISSLS
ncbi:MAG: hypothetical protein IKU72_03980 [Oscillospiraceae bacterium]|nr:hypothetical protein [Oscillospiraceae bacterium]